MVAGEDAEAAGVNLEAFVEAELGAEIGDQILVRIEILEDIGAGALLMVSVVARQDAVVVLHEHAVLGGIVQPFLRQAPQEYLGVVAAGLPQFAVETEEQAAHLPVPAVQQVIGQFLQAFQPFRKNGLNFKCVTGAGHGSFRLFRDWFWLHSIVCRPLKGG